MPKRTRRPEVGRLRSRSFLWQRKQTQLCHTNQRSSTESGTRRSQSRRGMGLVGFEQNGLHYGPSAGQSHHRSDPSRKQRSSNHTEISGKEQQQHCMPKAWRTTKLEKSRRTRKKKGEEETEQEASLRKKNGEDDKRVGEAAAKNAAPSQSAERRKMWSKQEE